MGFLSPLFLIGLLAGAVPILLHLFRQQAGPVVPFSAVRFVPRVPMHRARRRRVQDVLLLVLRVAAVSLLAVSFARPYVAVDADRRVPVTVIAIDRSYSMSSPGRMERALQLARQAIDEAPSGDLVSVVAFDERAEVVLAPTAERAEARRAAASISSGFGATRYDAAISAAAEIVHGRRGRLVMVSDLQAGGFREGAVAASESLTIDARPVGPAPENLLVGAIRRTKQGVDVEVRSTAASPRTARVSLSIDSAESAEARIAVPPSGVAEASFAIPLPERAVVRAAVDDDTGYTADNVRYAVLDPRPRRHVVAVVNPGYERDALYLSRAVAAAEGPEGLVVETIAADAIVSRAAAIETSAALVVLGSRGLDARAGTMLGTAVGRGTGLLLVAGPRMDWPWLSGQLPASIRPGIAGVEAAAATPLSLAPTEIRHPVFHTLGDDTGWIGAARFTRHLRLSVDAEARVIARFTNGAPALVELGEQAGRVLVLTSDLSNQWNDFALQPAFVPFVHALMRHLSGAPPPVGDVLVGARPGDEWARPGVVEDSTGTRVAVNVDVHESDGAQLTAEAFATAVAGSGPQWQPGADRVAREQERTQSWWWYGLMLMLIGLLIESAVGSVRRAGAHV